MSDYTDRIFPSSKGITTYLDDLRNKNYQIPTFQREVVWEKENVKKLWDSIYKFYPLGSVLIWKTGIKLQNHREIGGHKINDENFNKTEYQYILDGQQRTTSLLTSLYGGTIEGRANFNPTLYVDLSIENQDETDDESYKKRFLFWEEIDDKGGVLKINTGKTNRFAEGVIVKLLDIKQSFGNLENKLQKNELYSDYDNPVRTQLRKVKEVLDNYRLSFIELKGIQVSEVCQIFERINQAGKPLNIFDIVVAKTFRPKSESVTGFYLREIIDEFRQSNKSNFMQLDDLTYLQILATIIKNFVINSGVLNITDRYLNDIKTEHIELVWADSKKAILKTFDFFENHLNLNGINLIPYRYLYFTISPYFYQNVNPNYEFLKQYFWYTAFHNEDLLSSTSQLAEQVDLLLKNRKDSSTPLPKFVIDKNKLRNSSYSSKGRISRAILSLYANQEPKDWKLIDRNVIVDNFFFSTDRPNLHHIFPLDYIAKNQSANKLSSNSLMNIAYLTQITNLEISNKNPLNYLKDYDNQNFENVLKTHLIPIEIIEWSRHEQMPENALDIFIEKRIDLIIGKLRESNPNLNVTDTNVIIDNQNNVE